jgi:hypothetical protein
MNEGGSSNGREKDERMDGRRRERILAEEDERMEGR